MPNCVPERLCQWPECTFSVITKQHFTTKYGGHVYMAFIFSETEQNWFIQQTFVEPLLCARHGPRSKDTVGYKPDTLPALTELTLVTRNALLKPQSRGTPDPRSALAQAFKTSLEISFHHRLPQPPSTKFHKGTLCLRKYTLLGKYKPIGKHFFFGLSHSRQ